MVQKMRDLAKGMKMVCLLLSKDPSSVLECTVEGDKFTLAIP
jgi:hypothetical protein